MNDAYIARDGYSYEKASIEEWLATKSTSPATGERLARTSVVRNIALNKVIEWYRAHPTGPIPIEDVDVCPISYEEPKDRVRQRKRDAAEKRKRDVCVKKIQWDY